MMMREICRGRRTKKEVNQPRGKRWIYARLLPKSLVRRNMHDFL